MAMKNSESDPYIKQLEEKVDFYENIFNKIPATIFLNDCRKSELQWAPYGNGSVLKYTKADYNEMGSRFFSEKYHPDDLATTLESFKYFNENDGPLSAVARVKDKDDIWKWLYSVSVVMNRGKDGLPDSTLGIVLDLSHKIFSEKRVDEIVKENLRLKNQITNKCITKREKEVLKLIARGLTCIKIAEVLSISFHTVDTHRKNLMRKLGLHNISELTAFAVENGLN
jgi:DNA-binding CsgD family transcriptional regulator